MVFYATVWEFIGFGLILLLVSLAIFAIIEPGAIQQRSREKDGKTTIFKK